MSAHEWFSIGKWVFVAMPWMFTLLSAFAEIGAMSAAFRSGATTDDVGGAVLGAFVTIAALSLSCWMTGVVSG